MKKETKNEYPKVKIIHNIKIEDGVEVVNNFDIKVYENDISSDYMFSQSKSVLLKLRDEISRVLTQE